MAIHEWSDQILIVTLNDEPAFSEDMDALLQRVESKRNKQSSPHVILDMKSMRRINSSNISHLITLRKLLNSTNSRLRVCSVNDSIWTVFLTTGLDGLFQFNEDVSTALASLQLKAAP